MAGIIKNKQVYAGYTSDEHINEVIKSKIATTIDSSSTNDQLVGAKDMYDMLTAEKINMGSYMDDLNNIPYIDNTNVYIYRVWASETANKPVSRHGVVYHSYYSTNMSYATQLFISIIGEIYIRNKNNGTWSTWRKISCSSIEDVPVTNITSFNDSTLSGTITYTVRNGICYGVLMNVKGTMKGSNLPVCELPSSSIGIHIPLMSASADVGQVGILFPSSSGSTDGKTLFNMHLFKENTSIYTSFSYPVLEN